MLKNRGLKSFLIAAGLENLKQLILDKIKEEALIRYEEDTDESKF